MSKALINELRFHLSMILFKAARRLHPAVTTIISEASHALAEELVKDEREEFRLWRHDVARRAWRQ